MIPGRGVQAQVQGKEILAGNLPFMQEKNVSRQEALVAMAEEYTGRGYTVIYLAADRQGLGIMALSDTLRPQAANVIAGLQEAKAEAVLLTGDQQSAASETARQVNLQEFHAQLLPEDKLAYIRQQQESQQPVCMIGDGINDAPALKAAQVGIAMGGVGSDIAVEAADIALIHDDIQELPHLLHLARHMMRTIKKNLVFAMTLNFVAIFLAIAGILNPVVGALVHNAGSILVIVNSAFLLNWE